MIALSCNALCLGEGAAICRGSLLMLHHHHHVHLSTRVLLGTHEALAGVNAQPFHVRAREGCTLRAYAHRVCLRRVQIPLSAVKYMGLVFPDVCIIFPCLYECMSMGTHLDYLNTSSAVEFTLFESAHVMYRHEGVL